MTDGRAVKRRATCWPKRGRAFCHLIPELMDQLKHRISEKEFFPFSIQHHRMIRLTTVLRVKPQWRPKRIGRCGVNAFPSFFFVPSIFSLPLFSARGTYGCPWAWNASVRRTPNVQRQLGQAATGARAPYCNRIIQGSLCAISVTRRRGQPTLAGRSTSHRAGKECSRGPIVPCHSPGKHAPCLATASSSHVT